VKLPVTVALGTKLQISNSVAGIVVDITAKTENFNMYFKMDSGKLGPSIKKMISAEFPKSLRGIVGPERSAKASSFHNESG